MCLPGAYIFSRFTHCIFLFQIDFKILALQNCLGAHILRTLQTKAIKRGKINKKAENLMHILKKMQ
jgi:hypothetical protein